MSVPIIEKSDLAEFIQACLDAGIRLAKLREYAFVEPGDVGGGTIGMIGKERITLTAVNKSKKTILRWEMTQEAKSMVTSIAGTGEGFTSNSGFAEDLRRIRDRLEIEGIQVVSGEWKPDEVEQILGATRV